MYFSKELSLIFLVLFFSVSVATAQDEERTELFVRGVPFQDLVEDTPQSTSVLSGEDLDERNQMVFQDALETIPGFSFVSGSSRPKFFLIRGIGELEQYEGAPNPSVAVMMDGIDFSGLGVPLPLFDIEQVEVLRGPQGIRFGANGLAGVLNIRSGRPGLAHDGKTELSFGNDDLFSVGIASSAVIPGTTQALRVRASAYHLEQDGFRFDGHAGTQRCVGLDEHHWR